MSSHSSRTGWKLRAHSRHHREAEILSSITHDIKSPLASAQTITEILLAGDAGSLTTDQADLLRRVHSSVRHVIQLANNLLDGARFNAGKLELTPLPTDLRRIVDDAVDLERTAADLKQVQFIVEHSTVLPILECDPVHIERALTNVLDNAIKYTPVGGVVTLRSRIEAQRVVLTVSDTGCGIDAKDMPQLFRQFVRPPSGRSASGTGLGLFIVKAIVEAHGGQVRIESCSGVGTTVELELPLKPPSAVRSTESGHGVPPLSLRSTASLSDVAS